MKEDSMSMPSGILILARTGSRRLPAKVVHPICGVPVIGHIVQRLKPVPVTCGMVIATTNKPGDDILESIAGQLGVACFRGDEHNVLKRCIDAAECFGMEAVVRLGGDSPLCEAAVVAEVLQAFLAARSRGRRLDYASNTLDRCLPLGLDAEVFHIDTLYRIRAVIDSLKEPERLSNQSNVVPYMHAHPNEFDMLQVGAGKDLSGHRWTLDTPEDLDLITRIYEALYPFKENFGLTDVLALLERHPDWPLINAGVTPESGYWTERERLKFLERYATAALPESSIL